MPKILDTEVDASSCSVCGAVRPQAEIQGPQGCANCSNLKLIAETIKNDKKAKADAEEESKKITEDLKNLPDLDKVASSLYDNERGVWWLGINLKQKGAEPLGLTLIMDQAKNQMLGAFAHWTEQEQKRSRLTLGVRSTVKESVSELVNGAKKLVGMK